MVVEDVITTGGSTREVMDAVRAAGRAGAGGGQPRRPQRRRVDLGVPRRSLLALEVPTYAADGCPLCAAGSQAREARLARRALSGADVPLFRVTLAYDGTDFDGWQVQAPRRGAHRAGRRSRRRSRRLAGGARVRRGGRRAHRRRRARARPGRRRSSCRASSSPAALQRALNGLLPGGRARARRGAGPAGFHAAQERALQALSLRARHGARAAPARGGASRATCRARSTRPRVRAAARALPSAATTSPRSRPRAAPSTTTRAHGDALRGRVLEAGRPLVYEVEADGFLRKMVRSLVGGLVAAGRGALDRRRPAAGPSRRATGAPWPPPAEARGLTLVRVDYPPGAPVLA